MRKRCVFRIMLASVLFLSCGSSYTIRSQQPPSPDLDKFGRIYIGWLDLGEGNWRKYGFDSPRAWSDSIRELNVKALQAYCRSKLSGKAVTGSSGRGADHPAKGDLYIKLLLKKHEVETGLNRIQYLHLNVRYIDMSSGQTRYAADVVVDSSGFGMGNYTFEGQLNFAMSNMARFLASRF
jgi:hypothetical protein